MAAYFTVYHEDGADDIEWHVGEPMPLIAEGLTEVQADGHELEHILTLESHMPEGEGRRVRRWVGNDAQWIYDTLTGD